MVSEMSEATEQRLNELLGSGGEAAGLRFLRAIAVEHARQIEARLGQLEGVSHVIDAEVLGSLSRRICGVAEAYALIAEQTPDYEWMVAS